MIISFFKNINFAAYLKTLILFSKAKPLNRKSIC
nr:MAG TPA: hypothetical protein [Caudoviricetes sp.]